MHLWLCWCYIIITFKGGKEENEGNRKTKSHNKIQKDHCNKRNKEMLKINLMN